MLPLIHLTDLQWANFTIKVENETSSIITNSDSWFDSTESI